MNVVPVLLQPTDHSPTRPAILRPGLHYCTIGLQHVFLDVSTDRYFLLAKEGAARFDRFLSEGATDYDLCWLERHGIVTRSGNRQLPASPVSVSLTTSILEENLPRPSLHDLARAFRCYTWARRGLERRGLASMLDEVTARPEAIGQQNQSTVRGAAAAAWHLRRYLATTDRCLVRAIALKRQLGDCRSAVRLIIGVRLPFAAHSWVEADGVVLTDALDEIRSFTPILGVR